MINDDSLVEGTEDLVLLLFSDDEAVVINTPLQVFIIEDNDGNIQCTVPDRFSNYIHVHVHCIVCLSAYLSSVSNSVIFSK